MNNTFWIIRYFLFMFKHRKEIYNHYFGWHDYSKTPEQCAKEQLTKVSIITDSPDDEYKVE